MTLFRRSTPTRDGYLIVISTHEGITLAPDIGHNPTQHLTPAQALALADALRTAAQHQQLTIRKDPS